jgi:hypothetical protein
MSSKGEILEYEPANTEETFFWEITDRLAAPIPPEAGVKNLGLCAKTDHRTDLQLEEFYFI